jgi:hypothetical protein
MSGSPVDAEYCRFGALGMSEGLMSMCNNTIELMHLRVEFGLVG